MLTRESLYAIYNTILPNLSARLPLDVARHIRYLVCFTPLSVYDVMNLCAYLSLEFVLRINADTHWIKSNLALPICIIKHSIKSIHSYEYKHVIVQTPHTTRVNTCKQCWKYTFSQCTKVKL